MCCILACSKTLSCLPGVDWHTLVWTLDTWRMVLVSASYVAFRPLIAEIKRKCALTSRIKPRQGWIMFHFVCKTRMSPCSFLYSWILVNVTRYIITRIYRGWYMCVTVNKCACMILKMRSTVGINAIDDMGPPFIRSFSWLFVVLRIYVDLAIFQPYLDLEAGDNQSLKIQVARPGIEPRSSCSESQELNHSATAAPYTIIQRNWRGSSVAKKSNLWHNDITSLTIYSL